MASAFSLYDILGVERDATEAQIRSAFRKLTFKHHPDRFSGDERQQAEEHFQEITEAFNVLSRPDESREVRRGSRAGAAGRPGRRHGSQGDRPPARGEGRSDHARGPADRRPGRAQDPPSITTISTALAPTISWVSDSARSAAAKRTGFGTWRRAVALEPGNAVMLVGSRESRPHGRDEGPGATTGRRGSEFRSNQQESRLRCWLRKSEPTDGSQSGEGLLRPSPAEELIDRGHQPKSCCRLPTSGLRRDRRRTQASAQRGCFSRR